jgi:hypothetical protein
MQISFFGNEMTYQDDKGELNVQNWWAVFAIDILVDCTFLIDMMVSFRSGDTLPNGMNYFNQWEVAKSYMKKWFWIDLVSIMPFEGIVIASNSGSGAGGDTASKTKATKMLRLLRVVKILKVLRASRIMTRLEEKKKTKYAVLRIAAIFTFVLVVTHWFACLFYLMVEVVPDGEMTWVLSHFGDEACGYLPESPDTPDGACGGVAIEKK